MIGLFGLSPDDTRVSVAWASHCRCLAAEVICFLDVVSTSCVGGGEAGA